MTVTSDQDPILLVAPIVWLHPGWPGTLTMSVIGVETVHHVSPWTTTPTRRPDPTLSLRAAPVATHVIGVVAGQDGNLMAEWRHPGENHPGGDLEDQMAVRIIFAGANRVAWQTALARRGRTIPGTLDLLKIDVPEAERYAPWPEGPVRSWGVDFERTYRPLVPPSDRWWAAELAAADAADRERAAWQRRGGWHDGWASELAAAMAHETSQIRSQIESQIGC